VVAVDTQTQRVIELGEILPVRAIQHLPDIAELIDHGSQLARRQPGRSLDRRQAGFCGSLLCNGSVVLRR